MGRHGETDATASRINELCASYRATGSKEALGEMYELCKTKMKPAVLHWKSRLRHHQDMFETDLDDVVYDHMKKVADRPETDPANFFSLYSSTLGNAMIDAQRRIRRHQRFQPFTDLAAAPDQKNVEYLPHMASRDENHDEFDPKVVDKVVAALSLLPTPKIQAFTMHLNGATYEEIATAQGAPLGTVKSRIHSVHDKLDAIPELREDRRDVECLPPGEKTVLAGLLLRSLNKLAAERGVSGSLSA